MIISRYIAKKVYIDVSSMSRGIDPAHVGANRDCGRDVTHIRTAHNDAPPHTHAPTTMAVAVSHSKMAVPLL